MKKIILVLLAVIFSFCAVGCSGSKDTLRVLHYRVEDQVFYDWMVAEFEKEYNVDVQYDSASTDGWGQLLQGKLQGNSVDVFGVFPGSVYRDDSTLPYMLDISDMDIFNNLTEEYVSRVTFTDGKQYAAPLSMVSDTVFYNKDIFKEYGLSVPTKYDEFIAVCDVLKAKSKDHGNGGNTVNSVELKAPILFGGRESWPLAMTYNSIEAPIVRAQEPNFYVDVFSNKTKTYNDPLISEVFTKYKKISEYYQINSFGLSYTRVPALFALGGYAMLIDGSWSYSQILEANPDINVGAFPLPSNNSAEYKNYTVNKPGVGFAIHKETDKADLAKKFVEYLYRSDVYAKYLEQTRTGSVIKGVATPEDSKGMMSQLYGDKNYILAYSDYIISSMPYPHSALEQIAIGGKDAQYGVNWMVTECAKTASQTETILARWMALYNPTVKAE